MSLQISLVIPVYNEAENIRELIGSIKEQTRLPDEVIIVDGGSTDHTVQLANESVKGDERYKVVEAGRAMPGKGRNIGAAQAKHEWLAFTDAGIKLEPDWLDKLIHAANENPGAGIIYGNYAPRSVHFFEKCAAIAYVPGTVTGSIRGKTIVSCLVKKNIWQKAGGFPDWRATEDLVFMENAEKTGAAIAFAPLAMATWELRQNLSSTFKKFDLYSKYNVWAGRQAYWHYGVARQYLLMLIPLLLAFFHHWLWLIAIPLWIGARVFKRLLLHRHEFGNSILFNPAIYVMVAIIILTIDIATFIGWIKAILQKNKMKVASVS